LQSPKCWIRNIFTIFFFSNTFIFSINSNSRFHFTSFCSRHKKSKREKTSQAFRDASNHRYKSSKATRKRKRDEEKDKEVLQIYQQLQQKEVMINPLSNQINSLEIDNSDQHHTVPKIAKTTHYDDIYASTSAIVGVPNYNNSNLFNEVDHTDIQQSLSFINTSVSNIPLQKEYIPIVSTPLNYSNTIPYNNLHEQQHMMNEKFSNVEDITAGLYNQQRDISVRHQPNYTSSLYHQSNTSNDYQPLSLFQKQQQQQRTHMFHQSEIESTVPKSEYHDYNDICHNERIQTFPEYSSVILNALEPTPISEKDTILTQQNSSLCNDDDSKPSAKR
jgi:hypothetical protein